MRGNLKINILEGKRASNRMRWYELVSRMNEESKPKVLNVKVKGKPPEGDQDQDGNNRL
jgi:hypothetical protein